MVVVTKTHGPEIIDRLLEAGHADFGENRVTEARMKFPLVHSHPTTPVYHHIGPLQTGSARNLPGLFHWVQGVSSLSALKPLLRAARKHHQATGEGVRYLVQLNLTGESSKLGGMSYRDFAEIEAELPREPALEMRGFMTMGPTEADAGRTRQVFRQLREIRDRHFPRGELSMGMSDDWKIAVDEGATMLRIGTAITGTREGPPWDTGKD